MYRATLDAGQVAKLRQQGYDVVRQSGAGTQVDLVLSADERDRLAAQGITLGLIKNGKGQTVRQQAELMAAAGYTVYRSYDERGGIRDELYSIARRNPGIVKL
jgi:hypothetical protein